MTGGSAHAGPQPVPFVDLGRAHRRLSGDLRGAFDQALAQSEFVLGDPVKRFEEEFAAYCGTGHCVGVSSGTAALTLVLVAAGLGRGDEVIVPAHTYIASALAVLHAGCTPVFCDVREETGLIDVEAAAAAITDRTVAIMPVHLYGQVCDMEAVDRLARRKGLFVIEDGAQAHGATRNGRRAGSLGDAGAFSFYPSKNLGALGDGGAVCTDDDTLAERVRRLRNLGQRTKGEHVVVGFNARLDALQASMLRVKLPRLDEGNAARRRWAELYRAVMPEGVRMLDEDPRGECVYHLFPIRAGDRDGMVEHLSVQGIQAGIHYCPAVPDQPPFAHLRGRATYEVAAAWAREEISLPMFPELTKPEVVRVGEAVLRSLRKVAA